MWEHREHLEVLDPLGLRETSETEDPMGRGVLMVNPGPQGLLVNEGQPVHQDSPVRRDLLDLLAQQVNQGHQGMVVLEPLDLVDHRDQTALRDNLDRSVTLGYLDLLERVAHKGQLGRLGHLERVEHQGTQEHLEHLELMDSQG